MEQIANESTQSEPTGFKDVSSLKSPGESREQAQWAGDKTHRLLGIGRLLSLRVLSMKKAPAEAVRNFGYVETSGRFGALLPPPRGAGRVESPACERTSDAAYARGGLSPKRNPDAMAGAGS